MYQSAEKAKSSQASKLRYPSTNSYVSVEKENPRLSMTSVKSVTKADGEERSAARASLGEVN